MNATIPLTADAAVMRLSEAGLVCRLSPGSKLHIQGGTIAFNEGGIFGYERPFMICEEAGGFMVAVAGARPFHDEEALVASLEEAVEAVLRVYRNREMLPAEGVR